MPSIPESLLNSAHSAFEAGFLGSKEMPDLSRLSDLTILNQVLAEKGRMHSMTAANPFAPGEHSTSGPTGDHWKASPPTAALPCIAAAPSKLSLEGISLSYKAPSGLRFLALDCIDLNVKPGEFLCIVGPSGCGKSTLLHLIAGLNRPSSGRVCVDGRPVSGPGTDRILIFQDLGLFPWLKVGENIEFGMKMKGLSKRERSEKVSHYLWVGPSDSVQRQLYSPTFRRHAATCCTGPRVSYRTRRFAYGRAIRGA